MPSDVLLSAGNAPKLFSAAGVCPGPCWGRGEFTTLSQTSVVEGNTPSHYPYAPPVKKIVYATGIISP